MYDENACLIDSENSETFFGGSLIRFATLAHTTLLLLLLRSSYRQSTLFLVSFPNVTWKEGWIEFPRLLIWLLISLSLFLRRREAARFSLFFFACVKERDRRLFWLPFSSLMLTLEKEEEKNFSSNRTDRYPIYMLVCLSNQLKKNMKTKEKRRKKSSQKSVG